MTVSRASWCGRRRGSGVTSGPIITRSVDCISPVGAQVAYGGGVQSANADCPGTLRVHGAGGGGGLTDAGAVFLRVVEPLVGLRRVTASMTGPYPGGMVAQAVCD